MTELPDPITYHGIVLVGMGSEPDNGMLMGCGLW